MGRGQGGGGLCLECWGGGGRPWEGRDGQGGRVPQGNYNLGLSVSRGISNWCASGVVRICMRRRGSVIVRCETALSTWVLGWCFVVRLGAVPWPFRANTVIFRGIGRLLACVVFTKDVPKTNRMSLTYCSVYRGYQPSYLRYSEPLMMVKGKL